MTPETQKYVAKVVSDIRESNVDPAVKNAVTNVIEKSALVFDEHPEAALNAINRINEALKRYTDELETILKEAGVEVEPTANV